MVYQNLKMEIFSKWKLRDLNVISYSSLKRVLEVDLHILEDETMELFLNYMMSITKIKGTIDLDKLE